MEMLEMKHALYERVIFQALTNHLLNKIIFVASQFSQVCINFQSNINIKKENIVPELSFSLFLRNMEGLVMFSKTDTSLVERTRSSGDSLYFFPLPYSQKPEGEIPDRGNLSLLTCYLAFKAFDSKFLQRKTRLSAPDSTANTA